MKTPKWKYTGDVNMLDFGGKNWRCIDNRQYQFIELINMDEACGRDNDGQPTYNVSLRMVDLNSVTPENIQSALRSCGWDGMDPTNEDLLAECLDSYGCHARLREFSGNNARKLMREAHHLANSLLNPVELVTKFQPSKIIIFEEADGFHWDSKQEATDRGYLDARGKGYKSRAAAIRAARDFYNLSKTVTE